MAYAGDTLSSGQVLLRDASRTRRWRPGRHPERHRDLQGGIDDAVRAAAGDHRLVSCRVKLANGSHTITVQPAATTPARPRPCPGGEAEGRVTAIGFLPRRWCSRSTTASRRSSTPPGDRPLRISSDDVDSLGFSSDGRRRGSGRPATCGTSAAPAAGPRRRGLTLQVSLTEGGEGSEGHYCCLAVGRRHARVLVAREAARRGVRHDPVKR